MNLNEGKAAIAWGIAQRLKQAGFQALFAGGCVRDLLLAQEAEDIDIATSAKPEDVEKIFPKTIPVGRQFGVMLVLEKEVPFEVATFRRDGGYSDGRHPSHVIYTDAREDALRRDFTINGLFYDPFERKVLDFVEGQQDIKNRIIRAIGDPGKRFDEDKLRLLRAVRFASSLNFKIEEKTWAAVQAYADKIVQVSPERIRDELVKILTRPNPARGFDLLSDSGLMKVILPEVEAMRGVEQPKDFHPEGDVFVHTRMLLEKLDKPSAILALAALFHDVGKPPTFMIRNGKPTFYEHAHIGAEMTRRIMKQLRFSNDEMDQVCVCVENHMKFGDVQKMRSGKLKLFVDRDTFQTELELHRIDCLSCHGMLDNYHFLQEKIKIYSAEGLKPKPYLNGHDLLSLGIKPGPQIRNLLDEAYVLQLEGQFADKDQALDWVRLKINS